MLYGILYMDRTVYIIFYSWAGKRNLYSIYQ